MSTVRVETLPDAQAVARRGQGVLIGAIADAVATRGMAFVALAGGSTPRVLYKLFASNHATIDWTHVHLFVSDDRIVPLEDERSNSGLVDRELLVHINFSRDRWHPAPVDRGEPDEVAREYERTIRNLVPSEDWGVPRFDIVMLGMGSDRHTASLFPGKKALTEQERFIVASAPGVLPPRVDRITFTFPLINAARLVLFLATGADKAEAFAEVSTQLAQTPSLDHVPAARIRPLEGRLIWLVDQAAASR